MSQIVLALGLVGATGANATESGDSIDICKAFPAKAAEATLGLRRKELLEIRRGLEEQMGEIEAKAAELKALLDRRQALRDAVKASLVKLYGGMAAEAAAEQIQKLDPASASELLGMLEPKHAGEIMESVEPAFASRVVRLMLADAATRKPEVKKQ